MIARTVTTAALMLAAAAGPLAAQVAVDEGLSSYQPAKGIAGSIKSIGSDTMNNLMALWSEDFRGLYPGVQVEIEGKGSSTAPPALINGTATFGPMSREMKAAERDEFEARYGYPPLQVRTAIDMLAVYVHKDNPIKGLTLQQIDAIFSSTRKGGYPTDIRTWGDLGLTGEWANKPISLYGRNSASGTYGFFKEHALAKGDYKDSVKEQPGSSSVVQGVASDRYGIGYSGIGYKTADVRAVPLSADTGASPAFIPAEPAHAYTGDYPLARFLTIALNRKPGTPLPPLQAEFLRFVYSRDGQSDVVKDGYFPITAAIAREELAKLGITAGT